jgi:hypothetical protein
MMADFYALILDADFAASKPLIPLHVKTRPDPDFGGISAVDPFQDFGSLYRPGLEFEEESTQTVLNTYSGDDEGATVFGVSHP